jgi:redox-sensitive bicupin YhaK (pirin superfamily)
LEVTVPAVTPTDQLALPVIAGTSATPRARKVVSRTTGPTGFEGEGFPVRRTMLGVDQRLLDPFIMMDEMGAVEYAPGEAKGTSWHPHRGFETVTYIVDGTFEHQDSTGGGGSITDGATQWMTAGSGILHIERPPAALVASGGLFHGFQLWVNLPAADKGTAPRYQNLEPDAVTVVRSADGGAIVRIIAGRIGDQDGPGRTHTPIVYAHATVSPGAELVLPWPDDHNALVYAMNGHGTIGAEHTAITAGQLAVLADGDHLVLRADARIDGPVAALDVVLLGGRPIREPVAWYGPFVMNTRAEIVQAFDDYEKGRMGVTPG